MSDQEKRIETAVKAAAAFAALKAVSVEYGFGSTMSNLKVELTIDTTKLNDVFDAELKKRLFAKVEHHEH